MNSYSLKKKNLAKITIQSKNCIERAKTIILNIIFCKNNKNPNIWVRSVLQSVDCLLIFGSEVSTTNLEEPDIEFQLIAESESGQCDFIGSSRNTIEEHIVQNHSECTKCKSRFLTVEDIRNHIYDYEPFDLAHVNIVNMVVQMG